MNDSSFLKASNIGKINKELSELKSRKVLSDMLDKYIDSNEELTTENTILKENQRRLVTLLETKDQKITEMKAMTTSMNSFCHDPLTATGGDGENGILCGVLNTSGNHLHNNNNDNIDMIEEYEWNMILHRISQGAQIVAALLKKRQIMCKQQVVSALRSNVSESDRSALCAVVKNTRVSKGIFQLQSFVQTIQKGYAIEFFAGMQQRWIASLQTEVSQATQIIHENNARKKNIRDPIEIHAAFYQRLIANPSRSSSSGKRSTHSHNDFRLLKQRREFMSYDDNNNQQETVSNTIGGMKRTKRKIIRKYSIVVGKETNCSGNTYETELTPSSSSMVGYKQILRSYCNLVQESKNLMSQEQVNEFIGKTQTLVKNIQTNYNAKCAEFDELTATHARVLAQVEQMEKQLVEREEYVNHQFDGERVALNKQITELQQEISLLEEEKMREIEERVKFDGERERIVEETRSEERRGFKESMERMMRQVGRKEDDLKQVIDAHEKSYEQVKRELLKSQENVKEITFAKEEAEMMAEQMTRKIQGLAQEKVALLANMEVCVSSLRELKVASDTAHGNLAKMKEEKSMMLAELEEKEDTIVSLNAKVSELMKKIAATAAVANASPIRNAKEDAAKIARLTKENEQLNEVVEDVTKNLSKVKKENQELTKEAIAIHQEKLSLAEDLKATQEEISELETFRQRLELRIEELSARLAEKEGVLAKYVGKPTVIQKLSMEKAELEEENERLKQEFINLHTSKLRLEEDFKNVSAREASATEELRENNSNMAALTREKLGFFKELSKLQDKMQKKKKKIALLKLNQEKFQEQIQEYDQQLQQYSNVLKQMDLKSKAAKNTQKNALLNSSTNSIQSTSQQHQLSLSQQSISNPSGTINYHHGNNNSNSGMMQPPPAAQQGQRQQQRQKSQHDNNSMMENGGGGVDSYLLNRIEAIQTNYQFQ